MPYERGLDHHASVWRGMPGRCYQIAGFDLKAAWRKGEARYELSKHVSFYNRAVERRRWPEGRALSLLFVGLAG